MIYIYIYIYENNRMKIKDRVLRFTRSPFLLCCFLSVYKGYQFVLLIWRCLGIKYGDEVILTTRCFRRFCYLNLFFWAKVWIYLWNNVPRIFLVINFFEYSRKKETYGSFRLHRNVNVLELPIGIYIIYIYICIYR